MNTSLIKSLQSRYAVKKFDPSKKLTDDQVNELLEAARLTATSFGLQLMKIVVVEDEKKKEALVSSSYGQKQVSDASHLLVLCREKEIDLGLIDHYIKNISDTREVEEQSLSGFKNAMANYVADKPREEQVIWMEKQVYIALGNLLTACALLEIGSCAMEGFKPDEYDEILGLAEMNLASVLVLPIGHAAADDPNATNKKVRRSEDQFVIRV